VLDAGFSLLLKKNVSAYSEKQFFAPWLFAIARYCFRASALNPPFIRGQRPNFASNSGLKLKFAWLLKN
tara:strand:+ start:24509 stop:24715 length:207 start_codon:yes stop_codon:yes gene_type:complete